MSRRQEILHGVRAESWERLCEAADRLKRLAPWNWMSPDEFFGLRLPEREGIGFVFFTGGESEPAACHVLLGWEALQRRRAVGGRMSLRDLIEIPELLLCFTDRLALLPEERGMLRDLGRGYRGRGQWPAFRSHRAGCFPWMVDQEEADLLALAVDQALGVAMRREDRPEMLTPPFAGGCLVRSRSAGGDWREEWLAPAPAPPARAAVDLLKVKAVAAAARRPARVQAGLTLTRAMIGQPGSRPQAVYMLVVLDGESGICLGADIVQALEGVAAMRASLPGHFLDILAAADVCPREIEVASAELMAALRPLLGRLPVKITMRSRLDHVTAFLEGLERFFGQGERSGET